jgi:FMN-dependent oxidoreductase (nitrilotriacetate monooxygenase family)
MSESRRSRILLGASMMNSPATVVESLWWYPGSRAVDYGSLDSWVEVAQELERGRFDFIFFADSMGLADVYQGSSDAAIRHAVSFPMNDPSTIATALAGATKDLGLVFTSSILQETPFAFARRVSSLDHLTNGRVGWNIVTTFQKTAAENLGIELPNHKDRYAMAEDYVDACLALWEGSWEDDAVVMDRVRKIYTDPAKVHRIDKVGPYFKVAGPHMSAPSLQRSPVLFQAGTSSDGRDFASKNAECMFVITPSPRALVDDVTARAAQHGRAADDLRYMQQILPVIGSTEEEARRNLNDLTESRDIDALLSFRSALLGVDFSELDLDAPVGTFRSEGHQGFFLTLAETAPSKDWTWRETIQAHADSQLIAGTPESIADRMESLADDGISGFMIGDVYRPDTYTQFVDQIIPELKKRDLVQDEYRPGTLREKIFGYPRLNERHPANEHRKAMKQKALIQAREAAR